MFNYFIDIHYKIMELDRNTILLIIAVAVLAWYFFKSQPKEKLINEPPIIVYEHADFKGKSVGLIPGAYNLAQLSKLGMLNDTISSIKITPGFKIRAFEHDNFQGRVLELTKSANYVGNEWNDVISSIQVIQDFGAEVFEHADFKGKSVKLPLGQFDVARLAKLGMPNDTISSIGLKPGYAVVAFEHDEGKGERLDLIKSVSYVGDKWNDKISSLQVMPLDAYEALKKQEELKKMVCNKEACNAIMQDWIVNKYWAFDNSAKNFGECKNCGSRWFKAPMNTSTDGTSWSKHPNAKAAFQAVRLN